MMYTLPDTLRVARYRLALEAIDPLALPRHTGSALRGGFGAALKQVACRQPGGCDRCAQPESCAYGYVFETPVPPDSKVLRSLRDAPRPFVLVPPVGPMQCQRGEVFTLDVMLIGRGMDYWPYFLEAFKRLGETGLGRGRGRFRLARAWVVDPLGPWETLVYDGATDALRNETLIAEAGDMEREAEQLPTDRLTVHLLTPTQLKHGGEFAQQPAFHVLIRSILRRLSSLAYFHCGVRWETDYKGIIEAAKAVEIEKASVTWGTWERFSGRQRQQLPMSGIVGRMTYVGPLSPFRPLLVAGTVIHVGKGTVFGNGQYRVEAV